MDTKYWGPSGWRLLHLITFTYEPSNKAVAHLFQSLPFVLPCKFCRASLHQYMEEDPLEPALVSQAALSKWLYRIHCQVNAKLRGQHLLTDEDPPFASVKRVYEERIASGCIRTEFEGWEFLFSVAENHPHCLAAKKSTPMNCPPNPPADASDGMKNQWNILSPGDRMKYYKMFWNSVGDSLPFKEWRAAWLCSSLDTGSRAAVIRTLWLKRRCMEDDLQLVNRDTFQGLCKALKEHRSGCGKKKRAKTCRKPR
jgi:hypothetical protein